MTVVLIVVVVILAIALAVLAVPRVLQRTRHRPAPTVRSNRRILFPFVAEDLSERALNAALRLAQAEGATLVPVFLARVSLDLPLNTPVPRQCSMGVPLLEVIEQRATEAGVPVDSRIERGRNPRHALRQAIAQERFDRIVIAAASHGSHGFNADDVAWLLDHAQGEIVVLRPGGDDQIGVAKAAVPGSLVPKSVALRRARGAGRRRAVSRVSETAMSQ
ncbi:MAG TPA: universal stress protein [Solirubrobacteraceae bacterium]|nr:universal stress protein [Solirubrobacteraceae bacterium]